MTDTLPSGPPPTTSVFGGGGDLLWILTSPCGCRCGFLAAFMPRTTISTESQAWEEAPYGAVRKQRMIAEGFHWDLEISRGSLDDCEHDPYLGTRVFDMPQDHRWLAASAEANIEHLAKVDDVAAVELHVLGAVALGTAALCGQDAQAWHPLTRGDPCTSCEWAARLGAESRSGPPD